MTSNIQEALKEYGKVKVSGEVSEASPHRLIQMLMEGALEKIAGAKVGIVNGDLARKSADIATAISVIDGLRASLDMETGGEIAQNMYALYDYMIRKLFDASMKNNIEFLDEVSVLMVDIKSAWDQIPQKLEEQMQAQEQEE